MRTVLFLINGFGIETKDSFSVYSKDIMPNFDSLIKGYMFNTLKTNVRNIYDGFRNMSLEISELYNYHILERELLNENLFKNNTYLSINNELNNRKSKLHLFVFVDTSAKIVDNLKYFLKNFNKEKNKKIFLHLVFTSTNYEDYPVIIDVLSKINVDLSEYATIGMGFGLESILNTSPVTDLNYFLKIMISEVGERYQSFNQKLDVSYHTKKSPTSIKPFVVNNGFSLSNNDICLVWNYDNIDITNFINGIKSINYGNISNNIIFYSLFPTSNKIPFLLNYEKSLKSLANNMKGLSFKTLVLTPQKDVNAINYYLNGLDYVNNPDITYLSLDNYLYDVNTIINIINTYPQELIIFNYDISNFNSVEELQTMLKKIDDVIGGIYSNTEKNSYTIIISSMYGINKSVLNNKGEMCHIDYDKVPLVFIDNFVTKKNYLISDGTISDLFKICYKMINKKYPSETLINKKNFLYRIVFK